MNNCTCPLCNSQGYLFFQSKKQTFYECSNCFGIFIAPSNYLTFDQEKARYVLHNNIPEDAGYQKFVSPIILQVLQNHTIEEIGLDFGCGEGSAISKLLTEKSYDIKQFDPFFANDIELLTQTYNYIVCCEVIEHFYNPYNEFMLLKSLLKPNGTLYCMTNIYNSSIDFASWYYKNDPSHVFIFQRQTLDWIQAHIGFRSITIDGFLICLSI